MKSQYPSKRVVYWAVCLSWVCLFAFSAVTPGCAENNPDQPTMTRAINLDEPNVNDALYLVGSIDNDAAAGNLIDLQGEGVFHLAKDWGIEVDFPDVLLQEPVGQNPIALGPIGAGLRYIFERFRTEDGQKAGSFAVEAQGGWAIPTNSFVETVPGSSWGLEALGAFRVGRVYLQGNYGYNGAFDNNYIDNWYAFNALGYALNRQWDIQVEADWTDNVPSNGGSSSQWVLVPQIGFKTDGWLLEVGLGFNPTQAGTTTDFIIDKALF